MIRKLILKWCHGVAEERYQHAIREHLSYCEHVQRGYALDHRRNGEGVADLIRSVVFDAVQEEIGDSSRPRGGASRADVLEFDEAVNQFADRVAQDIGILIQGMPLRNSTEAKWGKPNVRNGVSRLFAMSRKDGRCTSVMLDAFARIWAKAHKDERFRDVLTPAQQAEWRKLSPQAKRAVNYAVSQGWTFHKEAQP